MKSEVFLLDCMEGMKQYPDKYFDLAVCDPPYGIGADVAQNKAAESRIKAGGRSKSGRGYKLYKTTNWDSSAPSIEYFNELFRISKHQIIWGGNYFTDSLHPSMGWIIWDKGQRDFSLADAELAWTSFDKAIRIFEYSRGKALLDGRIHPTQKPVALYDWIYAKYLPQGGKVLDTHLGSGSNRIAADKAGNIDFTAFEIDKDYFEAQEERFRLYKSQLNIFQPCT